LKKTIGLVFVFIFMALVSFNVILSVKGTENAKALAATNDVYWITCYSSSRAEDGYTHTDCSSCTSKTGEGYDSGSCPRSY
jgi:hypothetical protein